MKKAITILLSILINIGVVYMLGPTFNPATVALPFFNLMTGMVL